MGQGAVFTKREARQYLKVYGKQLRAKRKKLSLTQLEVAHIIGCSQAVISFIECGYMLPPAEIESELLELYEEE